MLFTLIQEFSTLSVSWPGVPRATVAHAAAGSLKQGEGQTPTLSCPVVVTCMQHTLPYSICHHDAVHVNQCM